MHRVRDSEKIPGWHVYHCSWCRQDVHSPYGPERQVHFCKEKLPILGNIGGWLGVLLEGCWVSKSVYRHAKAYCGFKPQCGCSAREAALNTLGERCATALSASYGATKGLGVR